MNRFDKIVLTQDYYTEDIFGCQQNIHAVKDNPTADDIDVAVDMMWLRECGFTLEFYCGDWRDEYFVYYSYDKDLCVIQAYRYSFITNTHNLLFEKKDIPVHEALDFCTNLLQ